jgi:DNA polymerase-3 subunit beta
MTPSDFGAAVGEAARFAPARPAVAVLSGILITADLAAVTFNAFDYEQSVSVRASAEIASADSVLVSGKLLAAIAKVLPKSKPVRIQSGETQLDITAGPARFTLPLMPVEDYPALPVPAAATGAMPGDVFADLVTRVAFAAGRDDSLPMLTGVRVETDGNEITFAATDRFRLAALTADWDATGPDVNALVPAEHLVSIAKAVDASAPVSLHFGESAMSVTAGGVAASSRLLAAEFPKWRGLIPTEHSTAATVNAIELGAALKRAAVTTDGFPHVDIAFGEDGALVSSATDAVGSTAELVPATLLGDPIRIRTNAGFLAAAVTGTGSQSVTFGIDAANRPVAVYGGEHEFGDQFIAPATRYRHLVMPVRGTNNG